MQSKDVRINTKLGFREKLEQLKPQLYGRIVKLDDDLSIMLGGECFSGSMKGVGAWGLLMNILNLKGEDYFRGKTLIDASSGNLAVALSHLGKYLNLSCRVIVSTKATKANRDLIAIHGSEISVGGDTTLECYLKAKEIESSEPDKYILTSQLENWGSPYGHYLITGPQILQEVPDVSEVYLAMGTGGGTNGVSKYLHEMAPHIDVFVTVVEPGNRLVGTFSAEADFETPFIKEVRRKQWLTEELPITYDAAIRNTLAIQRDYGPLVGISAGGVYAAYKKRRLAGKTKGHAIILAWDGFRPWLDKFM